MAKWLTLSDGVPDRANHNHLRAAMYRSVLTASIRTWRHLHDQWIGTLRAEGDVPCGRYRASQAAA